MPPVIEMLLLHRIPTARNPIDVPMDIITESKSVMKAQRICGDPSLLNGEGRVNADKGAKNDQTGVG